MLQASEKAETCGDFLAFFMYFQYIDSSQKVENKQKDFDAAHALAFGTLKKFLKEAGLYAEYGDIAMLQKNWAEARKRWAFMKKKCPQNPSSYYLELWR